MARRALEPSRERQIFRTGRGIAARVVVHHDQSGRAWCETRRHEDIGHRDRRARARPARDEVPREQPEARGHTRHPEDLDDLIRDQWRQGRGGHARCAHRDDLAAIVDICRRLDGLPLAIELAAAATPLLAPTELADRLDKALALPTAGPRDAPARQRTLEAAFEWSYGLLDEDERRAFERFAVFTRGGTPEAAERVTGATLETLQAILAKSLLTRRIDRGESRLAVHAPDRP